jgi:hypothetical protein
MTNNHGTNKQPSVFKHHMNNYFVETGTNLGLGIDEALEAGFKHIISIELSEELHNICKERFKDNENVTLIHGDSAKVLNDAIGWINEPITFWLDAHYCGGCHHHDKEIISSIENPSPVLKELEIINIHHIKEHTIMIDNYAHFGYGEIAPLLWKINPDYKLRLIRGTYPHDVILAKL